MHYRIWDLISFDNALPAPYNVPISIFRGEKSKEQGGQVSFFCPHT